MFLFENGHKISCKRPGTQQRFWTNSAKLSRWRFKIERKTLSFIFNLVLWVKPSATPFQPTVTWAYCINPVSFLLLTDLLVSWLILAMVAVGWIGVAPSTHVYFLSILYLNHKLFKSFEFYGEILKLNLTVLLLNLLQSKNSFKKN